MLSPFWLSGSLDGHSCRPGTYLATASATCGSAYTCGCTPARASLTYSVCGCGGVVWPHCAAPAGPPPVAETDGSWTDESPSGPLYIWNPAALTEPFPTGSSGSPATPPDDDSG
ncbi:MAG TPA: hypothetical protein VHY58_15790, partial [Streptosporangiaceae bacterium]|nr:hypothetical protein [Streptosporangiaceae bacterium]